MPQQDDDVTITCTICGYEVTEEELLTENPPVCSYCAHQPGITLGE